MISTKSLWSLVACIVHKLYAQVGIATNSPSLWLCAFRIWFYGTLTHDENYLNDIYEPQTKLSEH